MSRIRFFDQQALALEEPPTSIPDPPVYRCDICGERACHGYGVNLRADVRGEWRCELHKKENDHGSRHAVDREDQPGSRAAV